LKSGRGDVGKGDRARPDKEGVFRMGGVLGNHAGKGTTPWQVVCGIEQRGKQRTNTQKMGKKNMKARGGPVLFTKKIGYLGWLPGVDRNDDRGGHRGGFCLKNGTEKGRTRGKIQSFRGNSERKKKEESEKCTCQHRFHARGEKYSQNWKGKSVRGIVRERMF